VKDARSAALKTAWPWLLLLALWTAAFAAVCSLPQEAWAHAGEGASVTDRLLGSTRMIIGEAFYEQSDNYFHRGVPHQKKKAFHDIFQTWAHHVRPVSHEHATGKSVYEVMPWLDFTVRMNPHHVEAYLVAAYWLAGDGERPDLAMQIVADGLRANPGDYQLHAERGRLYLQQGENDRAEKALETAVRLWPSGYDPDDPMIRYDLARSLSYLSVLRQAAGRLEAASESAARAAALFPQNTSLRARAGELARGTATMDAARRTIEGLFPVQSKAGRHVCSRGENHDHENEHELEH